jgi:predicted RNase H-like HicB family nuclease
MYSVDDYTINVSRYKDGSYVARVMEFGHLIGGGDTPSEAIKEAKGNLEFTLRYKREKGDFIPVPFSKRKSNSLALSTRIFNSAPMYSIVGGR